MLSHEECKKLAMFVALEHRNDKDAKYLPKNEFEAIKFEPHAWIIDAIQRASSIADPVAIAEYIPNAS